MILAIETAAPTQGRVAVVWDDSATLQLQDDARATVAAQLVPDIMGTLEEAGVAGPELDAIAVDCGPGSFTGIRIGIATARGLADGWGIAVWGVTQFDAFPQTPAATARLLLIEAGYGRGVFYQVENSAGVKRGFSPMEELEQIEAIARGNGIVMGWCEGVQLDATRWRRVETAVRIDAAAVGRAALRLKAAGKECAAEPVYLHTHAYAKSGEQSICD